MSAAPTMTVRRKLPTEVAAVAAREGLKIVVIANDELPEATGEWAGDLAFARMTTGGDGLFGFVMREEIPSEVLM